MIWLTWMRVVDVPAGVVPRAQELLHVGVGPGQRGLGRLRSTTLRSGPVGQHVRSSDRRHLDSVRTNSVHHGIEPTAR